MKEIILGGGCFWCTEAVFQRLKGVHHVDSGYCGGHTEDPDYKSICTGQTGHAEVIKIKYDKDQISLDTLLDFFFVFHDPTTLNRQGNDVGTQYRSVIYFADEDEKSKIEQAIERATEIYDKPILTEVSPLPKYYPGEDYHQNYYNLNPNQGYCRAVINPKVSKFKKKFAHLLKEEVK